MHPDVQPDLDRAKLLNELAADWGFADPDDLIEAYIFESLVPAICPTCRYSTEYEPDQDEGFCEECREPKCVSALVLAHLC